MGTAEEHVYFVCQEKEYRREDESKPLDRDRFAPKKAYLLRAFGKRTEFPEGVELGAVAAIREEAAPTDEVGWR